MRRYLGWALVAAAVLAGCAGGSTTPTAGLPAVQSVSRHAEDATGVLQDGGFESDSYTYWSQCGSGASASIQTSVVHSGSYAVKLGGTTTEPKGDAAVCQSFTVPSSGSITFWINEGTNDTIKYAQQYAEILNSSGTILSTLYSEAANGGTWTQRTYSLSAYAGQTVTIKFGVHGAGSSGYHIVQYVDDVAIIGSASPSPSPSPTATAKPSPSPSPTPSAKPSATPTPAPSPTPTSGGGSLTVLTQAQFISAVGAAKTSVSFSAYDLGTGSVLDALVAAAKRGVAVHVDFPSDSYAQSLGVYATDEASASTLEAAGGTVTFDPGTQTPNAEPLHAKLALIDGVAYLDGRNWDSGDVILKDTNANDISVVTSALALNPIDGTQLDTIKQDALAMEATFIGAHTGTIDFMTESFGSGPVASALLASAQAGNTVHVIVLNSDLSSSEETVLTQLKSAGVDVELNPASGSEKITLANGLAWFGSSNATTGNPYQIDWGLNVTNAAVISALQSNFNTVLATCTKY